MNHETFDVWLRELLLVADGPPETVWQRALDAVFAAGQESDPAESDTSDDEGSRGADTSTDTGDIADEEALEPGGIDLDADAFTTENRPEVPGWDGGSPPQGDGDAAGY